MIDECFLTGSSHLAVEIRRSSENGKRPSKPLAEGFIGVTVFGSLVSWTDNLRVWTFSDLSLGALGMCSSVCSPKQVKGQSKTRDSSAGIPQQRNKLRWYQPSPGTPETGASC